MASATANFRLRADMLPVACNVSFSNNGVVDFGDIFARQLSDTAFTTVGAKQFTLTLTCDAAARVAVTATDGRRGTAVPDMGYFLFLNQGDASTFGVGSVGGRNVGAYIIYREQAATADGQAVRSIVSNDNGGTWMASSGAINALIPDTRLHGWAPTNSTEPGSYVSISQPYYVKLGLNTKAGMPPLTQSVPIDGLATFTVTYL